MEPIREEKNIKIYVVCHKPAYIPENRYLYPIQVGCALGNKRIPGMLHDDEGDHISDKNKSYCELTAQYWAWKNDDADYYGFFHYRRYLSFDPDLKRDDGFGNIAYDRINSDVVRELKLNPEDMAAVIQPYDAVFVKGRHFPRIRQADGSLLDVYHDYGIAVFQHRKDLDITLEVLKEKYPEFAEAADRYMASNIAYECNMFIMKRELYHAYCEWLFDILFEVEKRLDTTWYSVEEYRVMGFLAERLCGLYYTWLKSQGNAKCLELPKTLFNDTEPKLVIRPVFQEAVPIVLAANNKFAPYLDVMIRSIRSNAAPDRNYDIIVLNNDISQINRDMIVFPKDASNISIRFVDVSEFFDEDKLFVDQHLSVETYYRLIIPDIMPEYQRILYLDCDMVADKDVAELYDLGLEGNVIGAMQDIDVGGLINLDKNGWSEYAVKELGLQNAHDYFQAGVLLIDLEMLRKTASCSEMIGLALSRKFRCHDQDVLNIICRGKVRYLPQKWNVLMDWKEYGRSRMDIMKMAPRALYAEYMAARNHPYIIHYAGYQKPWDAADCDMAGYFWKYAAKSPYYPQLLRNWTRCLEKDIAKAAALHSDERGIRKTANVFLPYGSRRREWIKAIYFKATGKESN